MWKEFKVESVKESAFWTIFLWAAKVPLKKMETIMNKYGSEWWDVVFQIMESRRLLIFWTRETIIITFSRNLKN